MGLIIIYKSNEGNNLYLLLSTIFCALLIFLSYSSLLLLECGMWNINYYFIIINTYPPPPPCIYIYLNYIVIIPLYLLIMFSILFSFSLSSAILSLQLFSPTSELLYSFNSMFNLIILIIVIVIIMLYLLPFLRN